MYVPVYIYHIDLWSYLVQTKFMDTKSSDSFVYKLIIYTSLGNLKTIHFGNPKWRRSHFDHDQQNHNFSKFTYEYYTKCGFSITLIVMLDAYKWKDIIVWLNSSVNIFFLLAKFEPPSLRWRLSRQNRLIKP